MLKDKVAIITGGTRGIGFEIAKLFLKNHAKVIIFGSREESVNKALEKLKEEGFNAKGYAPLLSDMEEVRNTFAKINDEFGHIDILINNAGISSSTKLENYTEDEYNKITDLNIKSVFVCSKEIVPYLKETKGVIINTS